MQAFLPKEMSGCSSYAVLVELNFQLSHIKKSQGGRNRGIRDESYLSLKKKEERLNDRQRQKL